MSTTAEEVATPITATERRKQPLRICVWAALERYFSDLDGERPGALYDMVLAEVEPPLLMIAMQRCRGNQSRAAELLGITRTTLRKKLKLYGLDD